MSRSLGSIHVVRVACAVLLLGVVGGCGKKDDAKKKAATQVAAKVNADEITVHQVNAVLARTPNLPPEAAPRAKREILTRLVDQQVAMQQALKTKLDRSPPVVQALEAARAEILARAYADSIAKAQPRPGADEVKKYYAEHPELFAQRRVYSLEEITVRGQQNIAPALREQVAKARAMKELVVWLQAQKIPFQPNVGARAAEQVPMEMLLGLQKMKDGEIQLFEFAGGLTVVRIAASKSEPVDEARAAPVIQQFLSNRKATEALAAEMKALKSGAKIEYLGEFAADLATSEAKAKADAEAAAKARAAAKAKSEADAQARSDDATKARKATEERNRLEAEERAKAAPSKAAPLPQKTLEKGVGGLR
ncbi:MAG: peptidyl-prolyl cis-trans isomerase, EpsD family [Candidatus Parcubacteria bacterium]|nr:peptidyl-prolyl cis-trans isomerase, EpsD family [Burkholderiales bacterium]